MNCKLTLSGLALFSVVYQSAQDDSALLFIYDHFLPVNSRYVVQDVVRLFKQIKERGSDTYGPVYFCNTLEVEINEKQIQQTPL